MFLAVCSSIFSPGHLLLRVNLPQFRFQIRDDRRQDPADPRGKGARSHRRVPDRRREELRHLEDEDRPGGRGTELGDGGQGNRDLVAPGGGHGEGGGAHGGREGHAEDKDWSAAKPVHGQPAEDVARDLRDKLSGVNPIPMGEK